MDFLFLFIYLVSMAMSFGPNGTINTTEESPQKNKKQKTPQKKGAVVNVMSSSPMSYLCCLPIVCFLFFKLMFMVQ